MPRAPRVIRDASLTRYAYRCWPNGCPRDRSCCMQLTPEATAREVRAVDGVMDELARAVPRLHDGDDYASVFVEDDDGFVIEGDDRGWCPFLVRTRRHALCAIHRLALDTNRPVASIKPASCRHWPIIVEPEGQAVRLLVHPAAEGFGCVAPRHALPGQPSVADAFADEIAEIIAGLGRAR